MSNSMKSMRAAKGMSRSFCFVLLLLTCSALSAQDNNEEHRVRNIVLVHGAWAGGEQEKVRCRERLGGLLKYYERDAA